MEVLTIIITSGIVTALINIGWKYVENQTAFKNAKYMQISNYYRDKSGDDMHKILNDWTDMLMSPNDPAVAAKMSDSNHINKLLKDTFLYSSPETCKRLVNYQTDNYQNTEGESFHKKIVLIAGIIVSLKHDFTGEWVSIEEVLRLKINDFEVNKIGFDNAILSLNY